MKQLHYIQLEILKKLLFEPELTFSKLRPNKNIENNKLVFHVEQLVDWKYIKKEKSKYILTLDGKEYANRMDTDDARIKQQAKLSVITCCYRKSDNGIEYLIYTRKKHPFYNHQGFNSGKINFGENALEAANRELKEETNLEGDPEIFLVEHQRVFDKSTKRLVEDKFFFYTRVSNPICELIPNNEGLFEWVAEDNIPKYITKPFESVEKIQKVIKKLNSFDGTNLTFEELDHWTEGF